MKKEFEGWLGGSYEHTGLHNNKKDAEEGYVVVNGLGYLHELFEEYDTKKIKITVEILEG